MREKLYSTKRSRYFDMLKGILILLVVYGHCIQYGSGLEFYRTEAYFENVVFKAIYSFHMPLFAIVSGYLFWNSVSRKSGRLCLKKQVAALCIPTLAWSLTISFGKKAAQLILTDAVFDLSWAMEVAHDCVAGLWFLWAMFFCSVIVLIGRRFFADHIAFYGIIGGGFLLLPNVLNFDRYCFLFPYYAGAYLFNKYSAAQKLSKNCVKWTGVVSIAIWLVAVCFFGKEHYVYTTGTCVITENTMAQAGVDLYRWMTGLAGCIALMCAAAWLDAFDNPMIDLLAALGTKTMGIYIISSYANVYLLLKITGGMHLNYGLALVETGIMLALTTGVIWLIRRIRWINKIYLGGR